MALTRCNPKAEQQVVTYHFDHRMSMTVTGRYFDCKPHLSHEGDTLVFPCSMFSFSQPTSCLLLYKLAHTWQKNNLRWGWWDEYKNTRSSKMWQVLIICSRAVPHPIMPYYVITNMKSAVIWEEVSPWLSSKSLLIIFAVAGSCPQLTLIPIT